MLQEFIIIQYLMTQIKRSCCFCFIPSQNFSSTMLDNWIQICLKRTFGDQQLDFFQTHWSILAFSKNSHTVLVWRFQFSFSCVKSEKKQVVETTFGWKSMFPFFQKKGRKLKAQKGNPPWPTKCPHGHQGNLTGYDLVIFASTVVGDPISAGNE